MCFQIGSTYSVQTVHGANNGKYSKVNEPGVDLSSATQASAAKPLNANQLVIEIASTDDDTSSSEGSEEGATLCLPLIIRLRCPLVKRKSNPLHRPAVDSLHQLPPLHHGGGKAYRDIKWCV